MLKLNLHNARHLLSHVRIMTGVQPTGNLTIGNYLGSIDNLIGLQKRFPQSEVFLAIVDMHSLTTAFEVDHSKIKYEGVIHQHTMQIAKAMICSGVKLDQKNVLFVQSLVKEHAQLCWILGCMGPQHWLNMMIQYKEKSHQNSSLGIYSYPVLMTADILLYKANYVPVGEDQKQHLELAKKYAERFNGIAQEQFFPIPKYTVARTPKVMSLTDPSKKMSKSDPNERSRINMSDSKDQIANKIRRAVTDAQGNLITYDPEGRKGLANLLKLYEAFSGRTIQEVKEQFRGKKIADLKLALIELMSSRLGQIQYNMANLSDEELNKILVSGSDRARGVASKTVEQIKKILKMYN